MNYRLLIYILRQVMRLLALCMLIPFVSSAILGEVEVFFSFAAMIVVLVGLSLLLGIVKTKKKSIYAREGFIVVALTWMMISFFSAVALFFTGHYASFVDALFESVAGFTTTGSSVIRDLTAMPKSILLWRSFTQWLGGMGVLVFIVAVLPMTGGRMHHLMRAESPGPAPGKLVPRMKDTASILYFIYAGMTLAQMILLIVGGMPVFDSVLISLSTASTGGFGVSYPSIASYGNVYAQWVITVFMILFGTNFHVLFLLFRRRWKAALRNEEVLWYLGIFAVSSILIGCNIYSQYTSVGETVRIASFEAASILTTSGFSSADFTLWPQFSRGILIVLMFLGGCAGSTSGGIKISRIIIMVKICKKQIKKFLNSRAVTVVKMNGQTVEEETLGGISAYIIAYFLVLLISFLLLSAGGMSFEETVTASISSLNNIGPGLGSIGPMGNYADVPAFCKLILSLNMLIGRLEIFPMIVLMSPSVWRNR